MRRNERKKVVFVVLFVVCLLCAVCVFQRIFVVVKKRMSEEVIRILSNLCKVKSIELINSLTIFHSEGAEIKKLQNPFQIFKESLIPRVFLLSNDYKIGWVLNDAVDECMICNEPFSIIITRHHCRSCGCLACDECCSQKVRIKQLPGRTCRVCDICAAKHPDGEEWDLYQSTDIIEPLSRVETINENEAPELFSDV